MKCALWQCDTDNQMKQMCLCDADDFLLLLLVFSHVGLVADILVHNKLACMEWSGNSTTRCQECFAFHMDRGPIQSASCYACLNVCVCLCG